MTSGSGFRMAALSAGAGVVLTLASSITVVLAIQDPFGDVSTEQYMRGIMTSPHLWLAVHLGIAIGALLRLGGLLAIGDTLPDGSARTVTKVANGFAIAGATMFLVTMARDGYVHEYVASGWQHATGATQDMWVPVFASSLRTSYGMEIVSVLALAGLAPLAYGAAMLRKGTYPAWLCWTGIAGGLGGTGTAVFLWMAGPTALGYGVLYPVFASLLPAVWLGLVARRLWRFSRQM